MLAGSRLRHDARRTRAAVSETVLPEASSHRRRGDPLRPQQPVCTGAEGPRSYLEKLSGRLATPSPSP